MINYVTGSINTAANGSFVVPVAGASNWSIDLNLAAATATGSIAVYAQNDNPATTTFSGEPVLTIAVNSGVFLGDFTKYTFTSNNVPPATNLNIVWTTGGTPAGSISILAMKNLG
jgi:hypothetical protein